MGKKKVEMKEEDVCSLLQRYQASTILTLLREISRHPDVHLNWDSIFHKTTASSASATASASGIRSPRELQLLWRHLAYRRPLDDNDNNNHEEEDNDSDLDIELEVVPTPASEAALEAAACVKVLASPDDTNTNTNANANANTNVNANTNTNVVVAVEAAGKKRKWCAEEDNELRKAVDKWGEGNWSAISKHGQWSSTRTPAQLSQRWSHIRKKKPFSIAHSSTTASCSSSSTTPHLSESQLATRRAIDLALKDSLAPLPTPASAAAPKPKAKATPTTTTTTTVSDTIQRTAVAAGARILDPSHPQADALLNCSNVHFFRSNP